MVDWLADRSRMGKEKRRMGTGLNRRGPEGTKGRGGRRVERGGPSFFSSPLFVLSSLHSYPWDLGPEPGLSRDLGA